MSLGIVIAGIVILAAGILLNHFFPNRYWIAVVIIGIIIAVLGAVLMIWYSVPPPHLLLPLN